MKIRRWIISYMVMIATAAVMAMLPPVSYAADTMPARPVSIEVSYGIDNSAKGGRYLPVNVEYFNSSQAEFSGKLSIFTKDNDEETYEYIYEIYVKASSSIKETYYVPLGVHASRLRILLTDRAGNAVADEDVFLNIDTGTSQLFIGVLSDTPEKLDYFDDNYIDYGLIHTNTFNLTTENFPKDIIGLDQFDIILISNFRIRDLSEEQSRALMDWVNAGGVMILGTGERVDDTLGRYAPELLDDMYEEPEIHEINLGAGVVTDSPGDGVLELYSVYAPVHGGNVITSGDDFPIITTVNKENGLVIIAAYDFADISEFAHAHSDYADNLLIKSLGSKRIEEITKEMYGTEETKYEYVQSLINTGDVDRLPPLRLYALSIIAYILLAGPGLYIFLKSRDAGKYYRGGVIVLAVGFAVLVYLIGSRTRFRDTFYNYATIQDVDEESIGKTTFLNIRDPFSRSYEVGINPDYTVRPVTGTTSLYYNVNEELSENPKIRIAYEKDASRIEIGESAAFTPHYFEIGRNSGNSNAEGFTGNVSLFKDKAEGMITSNFGYDVKDAAIIFFGRMIVLGDIKAGETVDLNGKKLINIPLAQSDAVAMRVSGIDEYTSVDDAGSDYLHKMEESNILAFYRDYYISGYSADARVIAFAEAYPEDDFIINDITGYGTTLLTSRIAVDNEQDDELFRSALINTPVCISGEYVAESNEMVTTEPLVLEYQLGNDLDIISMIYEWPELGARFIGLVSWYNYSTGSYDTIDPTVTEYSADKLENYMSPSHTMRMRYTYTGEVLDTDRVAIPLVSVTGTER